MTRVRRLILTVVVGVLVTLPIAGTALADFAVDPGKSVLTGKVSVEGQVAAEGAPLFFLDGRTLKPLQVSG